MCFVDPSWISSLNAGVSRRGLLGTGLLAGLAAASSASAGSLLAPGVTAGAEPAPRSGGPGNSGVRFSWFGTNGWEITFRDKTILIDPYFERDDVGFFSGKFNADAPINLRQELIDQHVKKADHILIGHGHWDHLEDVPYVAKKTGAMVIGSETHSNVLRASGVPEGKIVTVKGGEYMQFDGYTIEVFPGLHSLGPAKKYAVPGHRITVPPAPSKVGELPEGDSLIYLVTIGGKFSIFLMSTANFIERAITGLKPDVALVASIFANQIHDFTPRLMHALNYPKVILPTHWDNFEKPFSEPAQDLRSVFGDAGSLDVFVKDVKRVSPRSSVTVLKFFESFAP
jgi:L-ascorbate metabolism protein UlaG (beta-lactamase superfamily)